MLVFFENCACYLNLIFFVFYMFFKKKKKGSQICFAFFFLEHERNFKNRNKIGPLFYFFFFNIFFLSSSKLFLSLIVKKMTIFSIFNLDITINF